MTLLSTIIVPAIAQDQETSHLHMIYMTADTTDMSSVINPSVVREAIPILTVETWQIAVEIDRVLVLDGLIIDDSVFDEVDTEWLRSLYNRGVVIATINIGAERLAEALDDPLILSEESNNISTINDYYVYVQQFRFDYSLIPAAQPCPTNNCVGDGQTVNGLTESRSVGSDTFHAQGQPQAFIDTLIARMSAKEEIWQSLFSYQQTQLEAN
jgi:hypothetical protein